MAETTHKTYSFSDFTIDPRRRVLFKDAAPVALNPKAFDLLFLLVARSGETLSKDTLLENVWADQFVEENNLTVHVSALRKALGERRGDCQFIATVPGKGYRFVADVSAADVRADESADERADEEDEFTIENHLFSRIVVEEFPETGQNHGATQTKELAAAALGRAGWLGRNRLAAACSILAFAALLGAGGSYVWQRRQTSKAPAVPFRQISIKRLTTNGKVHNAAFSPDGKLFVYSAGAPRSLWLGHTTGGEPIQLRPPADVNYRGLRFSPDSSFVYYVAAGAEYPTGALFRLPAFGGAPERLRENVKTQITFAPDASRLAFVSSDREKDASTLVISDAAGSATRELVARPIKFQFEPSSPAWSADGQTIAVGAVSEAGDGGVNYEVFAVSAADGRVTQLTAQKFRSIGGLAWLKDGGGLVMTASAQPELDHQLWHVSYPDGAARQINPDLNDYGSPLGVSADGKTLLAVQEGTLSNVWTAPADRPAQAKQITFSTLGVRSGKLGLEWAPDNRIIYTAFAGRSQPLWKMNADGGGQKPLTPDGFIDQNPSITADGSVVVFGSNRSGAAEIWRVSADGGDLRQLTFGGYNEMPSVSPDGKWAVYVSTRDGLNAVWRVPLAGGEPARMGDRPASWVRVSPDSRFVACGYDDGERTKLAVLPIEGGAPVKLFDLPPTANLRYALRWTPDGSALTYRDWENGYWRQPLDGGAARRIEGFPEEKLFAYDWSPDGRQIAFTRGLEIRDLVLIRDAEDSSD